jgi:hypothetical protein
MFKSPAFWSDDVYRAKMKTPLEFVASAVRATGAEVSDALPLARQLNTLGMPLYGMQPPTGYSMKADAWVNSSALLGRMNFSLGLTGGKIKGVQVNPDSLVNGGAHASSTPASDPQSVLSVLEASLLAGDVSKQTHDAITKRLENPAGPPAEGKAAAHKNDKPAAPASNTGTITGLILGSPEFQRR